MRYVTIWVLLTAWAVCWPIVAVGQGADIGPTVLIVIVDGLAWDHIDWSPGSAWQTLAATGGVALANVRPAAAGQMPGSGHLALGTGHKSTAGSMAGLAFMQYETFAEMAVPDLYVSLFREAQVPHIVHLGWAEQKNALDVVTDAAGDRMLGQLITSAGYPVWAVGNADTWAEPGRYGVLTVMDNDGAVTRGDVGADTLLWDPMWPFGWRTNYDLIWEHVMAAVRMPGLIVLELGDMARWHAARPFMTAEAAADSRRIALQRISYFIKKTIEHVKPLARPVHMFVVSPSPSPADDSAGFITPLFYTVVGGPDGPAAPRAGVLVSATTRRPGVVVDVDVYATVLSLFGLPYTYAAGRPVTITEGDDAPATVTGLYDSVVRIHRQRLAVIQPYFYFQLLAVTLATVALVRGRRRSTGAVGHRRPLIAIFAAMTAWPLAVLLLPLVPETVAGPWPVPTIAAAIGTIVGIGRLATRGNVPVMLACINGAAAVVLTYDTLTGASLMQQSHLGYDVIIGARFYGIGNEYMGLFLGSAIMAAGGVLDAFPRQWQTMLRAVIAAAFAIIVLLLASPAHGANVGGTIGSVFCFSAVIILFGGRKLRFVHALYAALGLGVVVGGAALYDVAKNGADASHLGRFAEQLRLTAGGVLGPVVQRKIMMNVRLIRVTIWGKAFLVSLVASLYFVFWLPPTWRHLANTYPYTVKAMQGGIVGAVAVLAVNDSGIVAAAMLMVPVVCTLLALSLYNGHPNSLAE